MTDRADGRSGTLFGLVVGLILGMLVAVLVIPERQDVRDVAAGGGLQAGVGDVSLGSDRTDVGVGGGTDVGTGDTGTETGASVGHGAVAGDGDVGAPSGRSDSAAATTADGGGTGDGGANGPTGPVRGVTDDKIKIGIAIPDLEAIGALGPGYDSGDQRKQWDALLDGWRRDHELPLHGRDIEFVYRSFNILDPNDQRAACVALIKDEKVFAVIATWFFGVGMECVAKEFDTPLLTQGDPMAVDDFYRRVGSNFFTLAMSTDRMYRNWVHWADAHGLLTDRRIGIYSGSDALSRYLVSTVKDQLAGLGQKPVIEVATESPTTGGPQDGVAVQQFRRNGVDLALLMVSSIAQTNFMQQADAQGYRPTYIENDFGSATSNAAASTKPPSQYDSTLAMTQTTNGDAGADRPVAPPAEECVSNYERYAGERRFTRETAEWGYILLSCDLGRVLLAGLRESGPRVSHGSYIAGIEKIRDMTMARHGPVSYAPGKHHGVDRQRTIQWRGGCRCWATVSDFEPLWVS